MLTAKQSQFVLQIPAFPNLRWYVENVVSRNCKLSQHYEFIVRLNSSTPLLLFELLNQPASLSVISRNGMAHYIHGLISQLSGPIALAFERQYFQYEFILASPIFPLTLNINTRVFVKKSIPGIIEQLLQQYFPMGSYQLRLTKKYETKPLTMQAEETDFIFMSRLMEEHGLFFCFKHTEMQTILMISDDSYKLDVGNENLNFQFVTGTSHADEIVFAIQAKYNVQEEKIAHSDWQRYVIKIKTNCMYLSPGQRCSIKNCNVEKYNCDYLIISVDHYDEYCCLTLIPYNIPYHSPKNTAKPQINIDVAVIESPNEQSVCLDEAGRYKICFPFDEGSQKGSGSPWLRLMQSYSGIDYGFHFPLHAGTEVLYQHIQNNPDDIVLLGAVTNAVCSMPVTEKNPQQNIIRTESGHHLVMNDVSGQQYMALFTHNQKNILKLDASRDAEKAELITLEGQMQIHAQKTLTVESDASAEQNIGDAHHVNVKHNQKCSVKNGFIHQQAGGNFYFQVKKNFLTSTAEKDIILNSVDGVQFTASDKIKLSAHDDLSVHSLHDNCFIKSKKDIYIKTLGQQSISIKQGNGEITFNADGSLCIQAPHIKLQCLQTNLPKQGNSLGVPAHSLAKKESAVKLIYHYPDGRAVDVKDYFQAVWGDDLCRFGNLSKQGNAAIHEIPNEKITLAHGKLEIIEINGQQQAPWNKVEISPSENSAYYFKTLPPAIILDYRHKFGAKLSEEQLAYFKNNGNNAVIFIHGYNVGFGNFSRYVTRVEVSDYQQKIGPVVLPMHLKQLHIDTNDKLCTVARNLAELRQQFPHVPERPNLVACINDNPSIYEELSGTGAHGCGLQMEYNLNCAAVGNSLFPWETHAVDYSRIINVHWPGDVGMIHYLNADEPAYRAGLLLVQLIQQLSAAGIRINIIAHSLGARVLLVAMQVLANDKQRDVIDQVFLWQSAVPYTALSPDIAMEGDYFKNNQFPSAHLAAKNITVLHSKLDMVLAAAYQGMTSFQSFKIRSEIKEQLKYWMAPQHLIEAMTMESVKSVQYLLYALAAKPALGFLGPDEKTLQKIGDKLRSVSQRNWLHGHSDMMVPNQDLFKYIYQNVIMSSMSGFGKYKT